MMRHRLTSFSVRKRRAMCLPVRWMMLVGLLGIGCESQTATRQPAQETRVVYHVVVRKILAAPSAKVISAVKRAVDATKLEMVSKSTTNIDALFHVQSALRKEFKIEIEAVTHHQTRVEISALDRADAGLAQIFFDRITSSL